MSLSTSLPRGIREVGLPAALRLQRRETTLPLSAFDAALARLDHEPGMAQGSDYATEDWFSTGLWLAVAPAIRADLVGRRWRLRATVPAGMPLLKHWQRQRGGALDGDVWQPPTASDPAGIVRLLSALLATLTGQTADLAWHGVLAPTLCHDGSATNDDLVEATLFLPLAVLHLDAQGCREIRFEPASEAAPAAPEPPLAGPAEARAASVANVASDQDDDAAAFRSRLETLIARLGAGDAWSAALSRGFRRRSSGSPMQAFARLRARYPMPVMYAVHFGERRWLFGASPGVQARLREGQLTILPVCGTVPRGRTPAEDAERLQSLHDSAKEAASLTVGSDDAWGRMAVLCDVDSLQVVARRRLLAFTSLAHTFDRLQGRLRADRDSADVIAGTAGPATVIGVPRQAAWSLIQALELSPRDWYTGAIARIASNGELDLGTVLRCVHVRDDVFEVRGGGLILARSEVAAEVDEMALKAASLLDLLTREDAPVGQPARAAKSGASASAATASASASGVGPAPGRGPVDVAVAGSSLPSDEDPLAAGLQACCERAGIDSRRLEVRSTALPGPLPSLMSAADLAAELPLLLIGRAAEAALLASGARGVAIAPALGDPAVLVPVAGEWLEGLEGPGQVQIGDYRRHRFGTDDLPAGIAAMALDAVDGSVRVWRDSAGRVVGVLGRPDSIIGWQDDSGRRLLQYLARELEKAPHGSGRLTIR